MIETMLADLVEPGRKLCYGIVQPGSVTASGAPILRVNNFGPNGLTVDDVLRIDPAIEAKYPRSRLRGGELLVTLVGSVGQSTIAPDDVAGWNVARAIGVVPIGDPILSKWANYVLKSGRAQRFLHERANTTVQTTINLRDLAALPIPLPPRDELEDIVSVLSMLDDKIELNRRMNETLEAQARALFRDWFVDFGPVKAKMAGGAPYLAPDLWSLFPDRLDDDGVPEGWGHTTLTEHFEIIGGGTPKTSVKEYWDGNIPWFSVVDTPAGSDVFVFSTEKSITTDGVTNSSARLVRAGTTIISARGTVGNLAVAAREMAFNQSCYALHGKHGASDAFVYLAAKHMVDRLKSMAHGSVFSTITRKTFEGLSLTRPSQEIHRAFDDRASVLFDKIRSNVGENQTLTQTRDLLLPKLMSGEIHVSSSEQPQGHAR